MKKQIIVISFLLFTLNTLLNSQPLKVYTDKNCYNPGDLITITVEGPPGKDVAIEMHNPYGSIIFVKEGRISKLGKTFFEVRSSENWLEGTYTVYVAATNIGLAKTFFQIIKKLSPELVIVTPPEVEKNSTTKIFINLNPSSNETILLDIVYLKTNETIYRKEVKLLNGKRKLAIKLNNTGEYIIQGYWNGNQYYNPTTAKTRLKIVDKTNIILLENILTSNRNQIALGENVTIETKILTKETYLKITTLNKKLLIKLNSTKISLKPDSLGTWTIQLTAKNNTKILLSNPLFIIVKLKTKIELIATPSKAKLGEKIRLTAKIEKGNSKGIISFYRRKKSTWEKVSTAQIINNKAEIETTIISPANLFKANWTGYSIHLPGESNIKEVIVNQTLVPVELNILDSNGRAIKNTEILVDNQPIAVRNSTIRLYLEKGPHHIIVKWQQTTVLNTTITIEKPGKIELKCKVYDLTVIVQDILLTPLKGQTVTIKGKEVTLAAVTDKNGKTVFKQLPHGQYTIIVQANQRKIVLNNNMVIRITIPPSKQLITIILAAVITTAIIALILRKYVEIEIVIESKQEED